MLADLLAWAWARHHNELSWYVRPLFLLPLAWAAHRRSVLGIVATLVAMLTSMAWFPAPAVADPQVVRFLAFERAWLTGPWPPAKILLSLLVPLSLAAFCAAFWRRSVVAGLALLALIAAGKVAWGVAAGDGAGAMAVPATAGLAACAVGVLVARRVAAARAQRRQHHSGVAAMPVPRSGATPPNAVR